MTLIERLKRRDGRVVVIGIGYVGLPLVVEFAKAGFHVTGYDKDERKVTLLKKGESYIEDIPTAVLAPLVAEGRLTASTDESVIAGADAVIVCVPTPLNKTKEPDISFIVSATDAIARHIHKDMCVVLESTTYPGTTRELVAPRLEAAGARIGETLFLAFSPERVDPSNQKWGTHNTPKVLGAMTPSASRSARPSTRRSSRRSSRSRAATPPRWSSSSRTPSAPSTSASSTRSR